MKEPESFWFAFTLKNNNQFIKPDCKDIATNIMENTINRVPLIIAIAMACHAANKSWCVANNDFSQKDWDEAEQWQIESAIKGVEFRINNPDAGHDAQHNSWMKEKIDQGWVYGEVKDAELKTHPCIVPFNQLPEFQQKKDALFCAIVDSLRHQIVSEQTFGQKAVGLKFNPGNNDSVGKIKQTFANAIDQLNDFRNDSKVPSECKRLASIAITESQGTQMWAVKALTWVE